jgi:hypothetical protein
MSARANAPVFQLHPSATGAGLSPPAQIPIVPAPTSHGFTAANAPQMMPNATSMSLQHQQPPSALPAGSMHGYHQRTDSGSSQGRRRNSSFSRRRADHRSRASVPPQLCHPLPQIQATSAEDLVSGARTAPVPDLQSGMKREGDGSNYSDHFQKRRREDEYAGTSRQELDARSQGLRSPDRTSQHSGTGSIKSMKREPEEVEQASTIPSPPLPTPTIL